MCQVYNYPKQRARKDPIKNRKLLDSHYKYLRANRHKYLASRAVQYAVKHGKIQKKPCVLCGEARSQGHHTDYSKRLEVIWLCAKHHQALHAGNLVFLNKGEDVNGA